MAIALTKQVLPKHADLIASGVFLIMWCFGVGFITFGGGPGSTIGNLYFSTWISFILSIVMFSGNFSEYLSSRGEFTATSQPERPWDVEEGGKTAPGITEVEGEGDIIHSSQDAEQGGIMAPRITEIEGEGDEIHSPRDAEGGRTTPGTNAIEEEDEVIYIPRDAEEAGKTVPGITKIEGVGDTIEL
jgi:hypothetical protein